jgi:prepilin-type N-terminal cleavage/methylation domain-containing protein
MKRRGFTLIEILVVIAIIASIIAMAIPNYLSARQRASDVKKKEEMAQLKNALRLYYNDYNQYPLGNLAGTVMSGCGAGGTSACPCISGSLDFAAGGSGCDTIYMKKFPTGFNAASTNIFYAQASSGDDFCLSTVLDNQSDPDIVISQNRCRNACSFKYPPTNTKYWVCAD